MSTKACVALMLFSFVIATNLLVSVARAQPIDTAKTVPANAPDSDSTHPLLQAIGTWVDSNWTRENTTKLERIGYVLGASLAFSLFDYVAFNYVSFGPLSQNGRSPAWYRLVEGTVQTAISYFLYKQVGLSSVVSFTLIWWTWGDDFAWYGWANAINAASPWYNRSFNGLQTNGVTWAGWTPIGLFRKQHTVISRDALTAQSIIGLSVALTIN